MNKEISTTFYIGWLFVWITFLLPEMQTRIAALEVTGNIGLFLEALPFIFLIIAVVVPIYVIWKGGT